MKAIGNEWTRATYDALYAWPDPATRVAARETLLAHGLVSVVADLEAAPNMGVWYRYTQQAATALPAAVIAASARQAGRELTRLANQHGAKARC